MAYVLLAIIALFSISMTLWIVGLIRFGPRRPLTEKDPPVK